MGRHFSTTKTALCGLALARGLVHESLIGARVKAPKRGVPLRGIDVDVWDYSFKPQDAGVPLPAGCDERDPVPAPFEITAAQKEELEREGCVVIPGVLKGEWLDHLRSITDWQVDHPHIWASPGVASGIYDYIQRNIWTTNDSFMKFLYHSPVASALAGLGGAETSLRVTTDLLMVNPNKGFKWHQDNQNGPIAFKDALRWWVTMDDSPKDYGAPVFLRKSQNNKCIDEEAVFVDIDAGDLPEYHDFTTFQPKAGDLIVWHARAIHKIDGPESQDWGTVKRRVLGGTVAIDESAYVDKGKVEFADMGRHDLKDGDPLTDPHFPQIWPRPIPSEVRARFNGEVGRTPEGFGRLMSAMFSVKTFQQFASWGNVLKKEDLPDEETADAEKELETSR